MARFCSPPVGLRLECVNLCDVAKPKAEGRANPKKAQRHEFMAMFRWFFGFQGFGVAQ